MNAVDEYAIQSPSLLDFDVHERYFKFFDNVESRGEITCVFRELI